MQRKSSPAKHSGAGWRAGGQAGESRLWVLPSRWGSLCRWRGRAAAALPAGAAGREPSPPTLPQQRTEGHVVRGCGAAYTSQGARRAAPLRASTVGARHLPGGRSAAAPLRAARRRAGMVSPAGVR